MRGGVRIGDPAEAAAEEPRVEGDLLPVRAGGLHEEERLHEEAREDEREERVLPVRQEEARSPPNARDVDEEERQGERERWQAGGEEHVRRRPEVLVDREREAE